MISECAKWADEKGAQKRNSKVNEILVEHGKKGNIPRRQAEMV